MNNQLEDNLNFHKDLLKNMENYKVEEEYKHLINEAKRDSFYTTFLLFIIVFCLFFKIDGFSDFLIFSIISLVISFLISRFKKIKIKQEDFFKEHKETITKIKQDIENAEYDYFMDVFDNIKDETKYKNQHEIFFWIVDLVQNLFYFTDNSKEIIKESKIIEESKKEKMLENLEIIYKKGIFILSEIKTIYQKEDVLEYIVLTDKSKNRINELGNILMDIHNTLENNFNDLESFVLVETNNNKLEISEALNNLSDLLLETKFINENSILKNNLNNTMKKYT